MNVYECFLAGEWGMIFLCASGRTFSFFEFQIVCVANRGETVLLSYKSAMKKTWTAHILRAQIYLINQAVASKEGSSQQTDALQDR